MTSSVVSFFRFGSTEFADTVFAGLAADQFVLADSGFALERDLVRLGDPVAVQSRSTDSAASSRRPG